MQGIAQVYASPQTLANQVLEHYERTLNMSFATDLAEKFNSGRFGDSDNRGYLRRRSTEIAYSRSRTSSIWPTPSPEHLTRTWPSTAERFTKKAKHIRQMPNCRNRRKTVTRRQAELPRGIDKWCRLRIKFHQVDDMIPARLDSFRTKIVSYSATEQDTRLVEKPAGRCWYFYRLVRITVRDEQ